MKFFLSLLLTICIATAFSQNTDIRGKRVIADNGLFIKDRWLDSVKNNITNLTLNQDRTLMTTKAILELFNNGAKIKQIFQYSENLDVTQADTVTALVLNNTNPNTANRTITLKAPSEGLTMYIYNYNSGIFANLLASPIKEYNNATVSILENETSYTLIGDGSFWRVVSKAGLSTSSGGGGGSAGSIVIWD